MADEVLNIYGKVRVITRPPHDVVVQVWGSADWRDVRSYHRISDDYAFTNARDHAKRLASDFDSPGL